MLRNYFKVTLRNIFKYRVFSFINIFGLALAIACSIIVIFYVRNEITFDQFHEKADRVYRPYYKFKRGATEGTGVQTPFIFGKQLKDNYPEIESYSILTSFFNQVYKDENSFPEEIHIAGEEFFNIFSFSVLHGETSNVLNDASSIILTEEMAEKYFGRSNVVNELLIIEVGGEEKNFIVKAVLQNIPSNSSLRFNFLISDLHTKDIFPAPMLTSWNMITGETYVLLHDNVDKVELEPKFSSLVEQVMGDELDGGEFAIFLQSLTDIHLNTDMPEGNVPVSDPKYTIILAGISILILLLACINFVTLSLGRSFSRAKEIGIRKSTGANRKQIVIQFLGESILMSILALFIGLILAYIILPWFNELADLNLKFTLDVGNILLIVGITILTGVLAGIYPALIVSGFKPLDIIKSDLRLGKGNNILGSVLVTGQFALTVFMIACTVIMKDQLSYLQNKNLGFDKDHVVVVPVRVGEARGLREVVKRGMERATILDNAVMNKPGILATGIASHTFEPGGWTHIGYQVDDEETNWFYYNTINPGFIPAMKMEIVQGRNFEWENQADMKRSIIVNEAFVKEYELENPIGDRIPHEPFIDHEIVGVVKNFHIASLHARIEPLIMAMNVEIGFSGANNVSISSSEIPKLFVRLEGGQIQEGIEMVRSEWEKTFPGEPFDYTFMEDNLKEQYEREQNLSKVVTSSSILAIIIGCLGLFGLSTLSLAGKLKEISIRKVFGASKASIYLILSKRFVILLSVAIIISFPATISVMNKWLTEFEYRINIGPGSLILAALISLAVLLASISYQGLSAVRTNPAETLRNE
jgi:putative ABC transport system permease protein